MASSKAIEDRPVTIESGLQNWQILQQDEEGVASVTLIGRWFTIMKRKRPEVRVRLLREGEFVAFDRSFDHIKARVNMDRSGKSGGWQLSLSGIPSGGPYRLETCVGSAEDAMEWRRSGEVIHFFGVGDLWLIAGQSNAEGYGRDPVQDPPELGIHQFDENGWRLAAHDHRHSPWLAFAKQLKKELGYPIGIIPTAVGSSAVSQWDPGQQGELFAMMKSRLVQVGGRIKGAVWYQGESDTGATAYPHYKQRFGRFLNGLRRLVKQPGLPIITVQLNRVVWDQDADAGWEAMREIQRQLSHELEGVFVIPVFEAGLCDGIHTSSLGNLLVAQRAANSALGGIYGRNIPFRHPECVSARQVSGRTIELRFAHVVERLDYECALKNGFAFAVRDREGDVPVSGYKITRKNIFRIHLARSLSGSATVTGVPGACPTAIMPRDINGYRSMLGFTMNVSMKASPKGHTKKT